MKKILITGADGFIGSHLTEALVRAGHDVRAFVLYKQLIAEHVTQPETNLA